MRLCVVVLWLSGAVPSLQDPPQPFLVRFFQKCMESDERLACLANKAAMAVEKAMDLDVNIFDGVHLVRNQRLLQEDESRSTSSGFGRLTQAVGDFLDTHTFSVDLSEEDEEARKGGGGGGGGFGGGLGGAMKKERKYMQYAFMVLLGIFGLTGPLIMKTLAIMAAKALIASKTALIIVGSVALKKIFEKDHDKPAVKVHTVHAEEEHDRLYSIQKGIPYWYHDPNVKAT